MIRFVAPLICVALGHGLLSAQSGGPTGPFDMTPEEFLVRFRPKAAELANHLYRNVEQTSSIVAYDDKNPDKVIFTQTTQYRANADRYIIVAENSNQARHGWIFRPDVKYFFATDKASGMLRLDSARPVPPEYSETLANADWWDRNAGLPHYELLTPQRVATGSSAPSSASRTPSRL